MPDIQKTTRRVQENVARVIVGKDEVIELCLVALLCEGHILLEDVPGIGKTTLAKALARSLGCSFNRIQFTPDLLPSDVTGISFYNQKTQEFEFRPGPVMSHIVLADEINRATPRTQSALLECMQERQATVDGVTRSLPRPFMVLATQNPIELEGTFPLPEAQIDRFLMRLKLGYPSEADEGEILVRFEQSDPLEALSPVLETDELLAMQQQVRAIHVEDDLREYIVRVVRATRDHRSVELGASPRGSLFLHRTAQAWAALQGRDFVLPDDVKHLAPHVLAHRLILNPEARLHGRKVEQIVEEIVSAEPVPVEAG
ncbi:MAG: MoxR family ATPase [Chloroflexi bacterium]|nr:MoxR family ATPase [Chloroflexota bacterium]MBU1749353.1 MoxR family ATPase [Chloroflexota bacterium]MBU1878533.1 MoxR family ATPase [Chloroflexota bacterium]